jgi:hypothetical protein
MFAPAVAWAAPAATGECYLQEATKAAWMESMDREAAYADQLGKVAIKLMAIGKKAKGHGPLGPQISAEDRKTFGELTDQTVVLRMKETLESARRRDIDAVERLAKLAELNHLKTVYVEDQSNQPDGYLQVALLALEKLYGAGTVAMPAKATKPCTIDVALAGAQEWTQSLVSDGDGTSAGLRKKIADYMLAIELVKHMNDVSELIYKLDMSDVEKAAASNDVGAGMGKSADAVIREGRVPPETAGEIGLWRKIDDHYLSDAVKRDQQQNSAKLQ